MQKVRIEIPDPLTMDICHQLVEVQRKAWLMPDLDILPAWSLFVTPKIGGHVIVAFEDTRAVGFAYMPHGIDPIKVKGSSIDFSLLAPHSIARSICSRRFR